MKKNICKKMIMIGLFAAFNMLNQCAVAQETINDDDAVYVMPNLSVDAERASYQALISRPQDEIDEERMKALPTHNPVAMIRSQNSSVSYGVGLAGATVTPRIRGLASRYAAVSVDGAPVNTPYWWNSPLSGFPVSRLKKITVANTGSAMVYGQNTAAGAINFVLPTGKDYKGVTMVQEIGGEGTQHQEYMFGYAGDKSEHLVAVFKDRYEGDRRFDDGSVDNNRNDNTMLYYKGSFDLSHDWKFETTLMHNDGTISAGDSWGDFERFEPWKMHLYSYKLIKEFKNESNLSLRYTEYNDYSRDIYYTDSTLSVVDTTKNPSMTKVDMKTFEALYNLKANDKNYINIGIQNQKAKDSHSSISANYQKKEVENTSFFIADSIKLNDKFDIHAVVRSDEDYEGERDTSYSLNTQYSLSSKTKLGLGFSRTVQLPNIQELYAGKVRYSGGTRRDGTFGNPDLENEKSDSYEIRLSHDINNKWSVNFTAYNYEIENMVTTKSAGDLGLTGREWFKGNDGSELVLTANDEVYTNINEAELRGYEIGINGQINDKFNTWLSYTSFDKAQDKSNNERLSSTPEYRLTMGVGYKQNKTSASLLISHQSETKATGNYKKLDSATVADFYIREQIRRDFALYLKIANIGNNRHIIMQQYAPSKSRPDAYFYEDGRIITVGAEINF